jgi:transcriptional regulator with GAF, ATPase, and Fis domain/CHASE2 domain-containing sensor protein
MRSRLRFGGLVVLAGTLAGLLAWSSLDPLEDRVTAVKYALRGNQTPDSSVVVVYIDNEAIPTLGWPVRRSFYGLMIRALSDLKVRTIGIEVQFEQPGSEYPEYDQLLASVTGAAGNVVFASYVGADVHLPFPALRERAAGIGHVNLSDASDIPLFAVSGTDTLPAFGLEVLRVAAGASRGALRRDGGGVRLATGTRTLSVPASRKGAATVNVPLSPSAFVLYPFLDLLKAYDEWKAGGQPALPVNGLRGKIVLVGVIAEGRSPFVTTPVHPRLPSLLLQAAFVDNALRGAFLKTPPAWLMVLLCCAIALGTVAGMLFVAGLPGRVLLWGIPLLSIAGSYAAFTVDTLLVPLLPLLAAFLCSGLPAFIYEHRMARAQVDTLKGEKDIIAARLRDREAKVAVLERELLDAAAERATGRTHELLEEIRRYKAEIRSLGARVDDMEEYTAGEDSTAASAGRFEGMVYDGNGGMKAVIDFVSKIAGSDAPVLILGESGTGKELIARALHRRSPRAARPFVAVNCGALAETLLESELFGHERGAFTGAVKEKPGRFELADGGTVFLDEIGEVSEHFQLKLLRVLQEGEVERVGGTRTITVHVRIVAATNKDLREQVKLKRFREDLFYRLNVLTVEVPPLRERREDIPHLAEEFLTKDGGGLRISRNVMEAFGIYSWPGNVRELESAVTRAVLLARADDRTLITMKDVTAEVSAAAQGSATLEDQILRSVREKGFSRSAVTETAEELGGLNRGTVAEYLRGEFLKAFVEHGFQIDETVRYISVSPGEDLHERVKKRLHEYLVNIAEGIDSSLPWEESRPLLKSKMKNLPRRYHRYLEQVGEGHFRSLWRV